jgi:hypothetical protein
MNRVAVGSRRIYNMTIVVLGQRKEMKGIEINGKIVFQGNLEGTQL